MSKFTQLFTSRESILLIATLGIVGVGDTYHRLIPETEAIQSTALSVDMPSVEVFRMTDEEKQDIEVFLKKYDKAKPKPKPQPVVDLRMPLEQQNKQAGALGQLYSGDFLYRLSGVFSDNKRFAALQKEHLVNGSFEVIQLYKDQNLDNYKVMSILADNITLKAGDREIKLYLYKDVK